MGNAHLQVLTRDEESRFVNQLARNGERYKIAAIFLLSTGLRVGELCGLRIADVYNGEVITKTLKLQGATTKSKEDRHIPLTSALRTTLYEYILIAHPQHKNLKPETPLFQSSRDTTPLQPRDFQRAFADAGKRALGRPINPHLLRHTFITRMLKSMDWFDVAELVGHKDPRTTIRYNHLDMQETANKIERMTTPVREWIDPEN